MSNSEMIDMLADAHASRVIGTLQSQAFYHKDFTVAGRKVLSQLVLKQLNEALTSLVKDKILEFNSARLFKSACEYLNTYHKKRSNTGSFIIYSMKIKYVDS